MSTKEGVLVLTQLYEPEPNFITADVARALAHNARVTVITAHPNYPHGSFYPATPYWRPTRHIHQGVVVWRLPFFPSRSTSIVLRGLSYFSFALILTIMAPFLGGRPKTVWVYNTPFFVGLAALWFKWRYRARVVYSCADLWPESFAAAGVMNSGFLMGMLFSYSRWINRRADLLICSTRSTLARYRGDGISADRLIYVPVWVDGVPDLYEADVIVAANEPVIMYAGNLGPSQDLETVIHAAAACVGRLAVRFEIYGTGSEENALYALAKRVGATNVSFRGRVAPAEAFRLAEQAMGQIVALRRTPLFRMTIPSKLFFSFAVGTPILYALEGEAAGVAQSADAGFAYVAGDSDSLCRAIETLFATPPDRLRAIRARLRVLYVQQYRKTALIDQYVALLNAPSLPART